MKHLKKRSAIFAATLLLLTLGASSALADSTTLTLGTPNSALSGFTGPFATVGINRTSTTTADVTFTSLTNGGYLYLMGDGESADLNVNATTFTSSLAVGTNSIPSFTPPG